LGLLEQDGYAVIAADGPGEYPVIAESRAGDDAVGVTVVPGTVAYVTTGGLILVICDFFLLLL
jgi:gephyrin